MKLLHIEGILMKRIYALCVFSMIMITGCASLEEDLHRASDGIDLNTARYLAKSRYSEARILLAKDNGCWDDDFLLKLAKDPNVAVRTNLAESRRFCDGFQKAIAILAQDKDDRVRLSVAKNYMLEPSIHKVLMNDHNPEISLEASKSAAYSVPFEELIFFKNLMEHQSSEVRAQIALKRVRLSTEFLQALFDDVEPVRINLAKNESTPPELLKKLAGDESESVRLAAGGNPLTPMTPIAPENYEQFIVNICNSQQVPNGMDIRAIISEDESSWKFKDMYLYRVASCANKKVASVVPFKLFPVESKDYSYYGIGKEFETICDTGFYGATTSVHLNASFGSSKDFYFDATVSAARSPFNKRPCEKLPSDVNKIFTLRSKKDTSQYYNYLFWDPIGCGESPSERGYYFPSPSRNDVNEVLIVKYFGKVNGHFFTSNVWENSSTLHFEKADGYLVLRGR